MADPYSILGVARGASEADIKKAYRTLAKTHHPDRNKDNPKAAEKFAEATRAYDLLSDKDKRARFDRGEIDGEGNPAMPFGWGANGGGGQRHTRPSDFGEAQDFGDIFEGLFGGGRRAPGGGGGGGFGGFGGFGRREPPAKGANVGYRLAVPFVDAATQAPQRITLQDGKTIDLKIPAGVESGTQMRIPGKGQQGPGGAGDAIITVDISPHAFFTRDGDHVRLDLPVTLDEAVKGAKIRVPTVDGPVMLGIPAGSTSGRTLRLKGKGFVSKGGPRGDQLVTLQVDLPSDDVKLAEFVEQWADNRPVRGHLGV
jgi:DnaJ-class molecular chaperone